MEEVFSYKINHNFKWSIRAKTKYRTYIYKILSIWGPPTIIAWQRDSLMKFWTRQYVGHGQKQTFFGRSLLIKNMPYLKFMATYATSNTTQQYIHALITQRHNTTIWKLWRLLISNKISRHYTLMNVLILDYTKKHNADVVITMHMWCLKMPLKCQVYTSHIMHHRLSIQFTHHQKALHINL